MPNVVLLDNNAHRGLRVQAAPSARLGDDQRFVAVAVAEFPTLVLHYPLLLSKDADTGAFFCGAMLGFDVGENLFLEEGKAPEAYRPFNLQRGPFYTAGSELAIDLDNPRVSTDKGQPLFTEAGEPTAYLRSIVTLMRDLRPGLEATRIFIDTLMTLKLVEPIDIDLAFDDGSKRKLTDLYTVNQDALRSLDDAAVTGLFRRGYLQAIYLMIASLKHVPALARRKNRRLLEASETLSGMPG